MYENWWIQNEKGNVRLLRSNFACPLEMVAMVHAIGMNVYHKSFYETVSPEKASYT